MRKNGKKQKVDFFFFTQKMEYQIAFALHTGKTGLTSTAPVSMENGSVGQRGIHSNSFKTRTEDVLMYRL